MDASTGSISAQPGESLAAGVSEALAQVNEMTRFMGMLRGPVPPPVAPNVKVDPRLGVQVTKMRESGNAAFSRKRWADAIRLYSLALAMASSRPWFEPAVLARDELSTILCNRSAAHLGASSLPEALVDADAAIAIKPGFAKAHFRRAQALSAMQRYRDALESARLAATMEPNDSAVDALVRDLAARIQ